MNKAIFIQGEEPDTFKRNLQSTYVDLLIEGFESGDYDQVSKAEIFKTINDIHSFARKNKMRSTNYDFIYFKIDKLLEGS